MGQAQNSLQWPWGGASKVGTQPPWELRLQQEQMVELLMEALWLAGDDYEDSECWELH